MSENSLHDRFWRKVDRRSAEECWPWLGAKSHRGYGQIWRLNKKDRATRVAWEIANGEPFPESKEACHTCDNPGCVNPAHIWPGTHAENMEDKRLKGRAPMRSAKHCGRGHEWTADNTFVAPGSGRRLCRECVRVRRETRRAEYAAYNRAYRARLKSRKSVQALEEE